MFIEEESTTYLEKIKTRIINLLNSDDLEYLIKEK
jgi:hypothetical protein